MCLWIKTALASFVARLHISYFNPGDLNFKGKLSLGEKQSTGIESTAKPHSWFYTHDTAHMLYKNSQELILMSGSYSWQIPAVTHQSVECKMWRHIVHSVRLTGSWQTCGESWNGANYRANAKTINVLFSVELINNTIFSTIDKTYFTLSPH